MYSVPLAGRVDSEKLETVPSTSAPVSVTVIEAASSAPLAEALLVVGASLTEVTVTLTVAVSVPPLPSSMVCGQLEQRFQVGLAANHLFVGLHGVFQAFARLRDLLGIGGIIPEAGLCHLLLHLAQLPAF